MTWLGLEARVIDKSRVQLMSGEASDLPRYQDCLSSTMRSANRTVSVTSLGAAVSIVGAWHAGTLILIAVPHAQLVQQTRTTIAALSAGQRCERATAGSWERLCACARLIWPNYGGPCPKAGYGLSDGISGMTPKRRNQLRHPTKLLLRRLHATYVAPADG
jgi:hypothetical protein